MLVRTRIRNQRLAGNRFTAPDQIVSWMGAVQAQEYAFAQWALALRTRGVTLDAVERAFTDGRILRTHVLRPTWHFVTPADIRWLLALTGPYVSKRMATHNRQLELDAAVFRKSQSAIAKALRGGGHLTRQELRAVLQRNGIDAGGVRLANLAIQAELDGVICSGPRRGNQFTYALLDERVPTGRTLSREEALAELTRRYFTSHGPATLHDFVWWSGLPVAEARTGIDMAEPDLAHADVEGKSYWSAPSKSSRNTSPRAYLLPIYDEYLIAYKDRSAACDRARWTDPTWRESFSPTVLLDGHVVGAWQRRFEGKRVSVTIALFTRVSKADVLAIRDAAQAYARFVGYELALRLD